MIAAEPCRSGEIFEAQRRGWVVVHERDCPPYICVRHAVICTAVPDGRSEKRAERFGEGEAVVPIPSARDPAVKLPKPRGKRGTLQNRPMKLQVPAGAAFFAGDHLGDHLGLQIEHRPSSWPGTERCAVMNLAGGDRDDIAGDSLHLAAATIGSLRAGGYQADTELVMAVARKAVVGDCLDSPDAGKRCALGTDFRLSGHDEC